MRWIKASAEIKVLRFRNHKSSMTTSKNIVEVVIHFNAMSARGEICSSTAILTREGYCSTQLSVRKTYVLKKKCEYKSLNKINYY